MISQRVCESQCNLMDRVFFQYLVLNDNELLPNSIQNLPKLVNNFTNYNLNLHKFGQRAKKFRQRGNILPNLVTLDYCERK